MKKKHMVAAGAGFFLVITLFLMTYSLRNYISFTAYAGHDAEEDFLGGESSKSASLIGSLPTWNTSWGGVGGDRGKGIAADGNGNVFITGYTDSFGAGGYDAFLAKFDGSGVQAWNTTWGGGINDGGRDIAVDGNGNVYITGYTDSFGAGGEDAFLAKFDDGGVQAWNTTWGGGNSDYGNGIAVDGDGNVYITGNTDSFGAGGEDAFLAKFDGGGVQVWNTTWGGVNYDYGNGITVDGNGNVYITGDTESFGASSGDVFLAKFDSSGIQSWNTTWGGVNYDSGNDITVDAGDNVYIIGYTESFGAGSADVFLAKFDGGGVKAWNTTWGGGNYDSGNGIAVDGDGSVYITGDTLSFGAGGYDAFLAKYNHYTGKNGGNTDSEDTNSEDAVLAIPGPAGVLIGCVLAVTLAFISRKVVCSQKLRRI